MMFPSHKAEAYMRPCIAAAKEAAKEGRYALAAMVVDNDMPLNVTASNLIAGHDPTAHPEIVAIRDACANKQSRYLQGCILVTTHEPCTMCISAAIWAKMDGVIFGLPYQRTMQWAKENPHPVYTWRQIDMPATAIAEKGTPALWVMGSVLEDECFSLLSLNTA